MPLFKRKEALSSHKYGVGGRVRSASGFYSISIRVQAPGRATTLLTKTDETSYENDVCTRYTSALWSPSRLSLGTALVRRGFTAKDTNLCRVICAAIGAPSTMSKGEVWALQWTKKPVGLRLSVLAIKFFKKSHHSNYS